MKNTGNTKNTEAMAISYSTAKFFKLNTRTQVLPLSLQSSLHPANSVEAPGCLVAGNP